MKLHERLVFGIPSEDRPLLNPFGGKVRLRFRKGAIARAMVRTHDATRAFLLIEVDHTWVISAKYELGRNQSVRIEAVPVV